MTHCISYNIGWFGQYYSKCVCYLAPCSSSWHLLVGLLEGGRQEGEILEGWVAPTQPDGVRGEVTESRDVFLEYRNNFTPSLCELVQVAQMIMVSWCYQTSGRNFKTCDCAL